jgi:hypothetical protein
VPVQSVAVTSGGRGAAVVIVSCTLGYLLAATVILGNMLAKELTFVALAEAAE